MGYYNISHFYTTFGSISDEGEVDAIDGVNLHHKKFNLFLTMLGFTREQREWFQTVCDRKAHRKNTYIFSGDNVKEKILRLEEIGDMDTRWCRGIYSVKKIRPYFRSEIVSLLIQILPDNAYRTTKGRTAPIEPTDFNPFDDPRADGIRTIVNEYFNRP